MIPGRNSGENQWYSAHARTGTSNNTGCLLGEFQADKTVGMLMFSGTSRRGSYGHAQAASWHAMRSTVLRYIYVIP